MRPNKRNAQQPPLDTEKTEASYTVTKTQTLVPLEENVEPPAMPLGHLGDKFPPALAARASNSRRSSGRSMVKWLGLLMGIALVATGVYLALQSQLE